MDKNNIPKYKIIIIGQSGVGKSSLLLRFIDNVYIGSDLGFTIGIDFKSKMVTVNDKIMNLYLWDTAGCEEFSSIPPSYFRGAHGVIIVYDVKKRNTFYKLNNWLDLLEIYSNNKDLVKVLVANKMDEQNHEVTKEEGLEFAKFHSMLFMEVSAKENRNVEKLFTELAMKILQSPKLLEKPCNSNELGNNSAKSWNCYC